MLRPMKLGCHDATRYGYASLGFEESAGLSARFMVDILDPHRLHRVGIVGNWIKPLRKSISNETRRCAVRHPAGFVPTERISKPIAFFVVAHWRIVPYSSQTDANDQHTWGAPDHRVGVTRRDTE